MEHAVAAQLVAHGLTFGVAESLTGGLIASRLVNVPGASEWFRGGVVAYHEQVKFDILGVPTGPVLFTGRIVQSVPPAQAPHT